MSVLLCLGNAYLLLAVSSQKLSEGIGDLLLLKCHQLICDGLVIVCKANINQIQFFLSCKAVKLIVTECMSNLSCTIRAEVKEHNRVAIFDGSSGSTVFGYNERNYKFICLSIIIRRLNTGCSALSCLTFTLCKCSVSQLYAIPSLITIHCIVTSHNGSYLSNADLTHLFL